ncbi:uncharacterized protein LOC129758575 [Uranotaenia lowii]|uniref:uncharacterized protein LOC129758575 n=1 Tax=Uranotaenia lowii TaxID=190385 RepID=UPI00247B13AD|nr:uncharacterized protein LOC129758575 [Uranotaenia lowii]
MLAALLVRCRTSHAIIGKAGTVSVARQNRYLCSSSRPNKAPEPPSDTKWFYKEVLVSLKQKVEELFSSWKHRKPKSGDTAKPSGTKDDCCACPSPKRSHPALEQLNSIRERAQKIFEQYAVTEKLSALVKNGKKCVKEFSIKDMEKAIDRNLYSLEMKLRGKRQGLPEAKKCSRQKVKSDSEASSKEPGDGNVKIIESCKKKQEKNKDKKP